MRKNLPDIPRISDAEWRVMQVLWECAEATANEVVRRLEDESSWKPKTVHTLLRRLVEKGAAGHHKRGREFVYRPLVEQSDCSLAESRTFLDKVFDGRVAPLLATFVEREEVSDEEIEELQRILDNARR